MHKLDEEAHETHDKEAHACSPEDLEELTLVRLGALLDEVSGVTVEAWPRPAMARRGGRAGSGERHSVKIGAGAVR